MTMTLYTTYDPHPALINTSNNLSASSKIFHKIGRLVGKTKRFFSKRETKTAAILSYWTLETVVCAFAVLAISSKIIVAATIALYIYGTYALFSAITALV